MAPDDTEAIRREGEAAMSETPAGTTVLEGGAGYSGDLVHGLPHGEGAATWPDGRRFEGGWRRGEVHGRATFTEATVLISHPAAVVTPR